MDISNLCPCNVFSYFEEICHIPHGSWNTDKISNYLVETAKKLQLRYVQDEVGNVIIYKNASKGYEDKETIILQGHMDMVAVSDSDCDIDMRNDGLSLYIDGDYLCAKGTSLGGDDGIAVAMTLALLTDESIKTPAIEAVFTVNEEVGMNGAAALDSKLLSGRCMINIDNEEEGHIITGCAGGAGALVKYNFTREKDKDLPIYKISLRGGRGGHSGVEINEGRANALHIMGRILKDLSVDAGVCLVELAGGSADNAIPDKSDMIVAVKEGYDICHKVQNIAETILAEYKISDPDIEISCIRMDFSQSSYKDVISGTDTNRIANLIVDLPIGVIAMSPDVQGLVETSANVGIIKTEDNRIEVRYSLRSSVEGSKEALMNKYCDITAAWGADIEFSGVYPGWKYRTNSPLRDRAVKIYEDMFGTKPVIEAIHAGLECGFFSDKLEGLDCISIGPDILDIHTTSERLSISSTKRTYEYLCQLVCMK